jgi:hypothetical protein
MFLHITSAILVFMQVVVTVIVLMVRNMLPLQLQYFNRAAPRFLRVASRSMAMEAAGDM